MKKIIILISIMLLPSCASTFTGGGITNTGTMISDNDFIYIGKVTGTASTKKLAIFFFILNLDDGEVYRRAMADMNNKVNLYDGSKKGFVNVTQDTKIDVSFFIATQTVTVTADVVEFIDE